MKDRGDVAELKWFRLWGADIIPRYLFEQIAKRDYDIDELYKYLDINCRTYKNGLPSLNPFFHIEALVDKKNLIKGFLWFTIEVLTKDIMIQIYTVDNHYWGQRAVEKLADHIKEIRKQEGLNKVLWITKYPKHSKKFGFKPSSAVLMEYNEDDNGRHEHGRHTPNGAD